MEGFRAGGYRPWWQPMEVLQSSIEKRARGESRKTGVVRPEPVRKVRDEPAVTADRAGITAFRGMKTFLPAPLPSFIVRPAPADVRAYPAQSGKESERCTE